jgi:hypothetical protein
MTHDVSVIRVGIFATLLAVYHLCCHAGKALCLWTALIVKLDVQKVLNSSIGVKWFLNLQYVLLEVSLELKCHRPREVNGNDNLTAVITGTAFEHPFPGNTRMFNAGALKRRLPGCASKFGEIPVIPDIPVLQMQQKHGNRSRKYCKTAGDSSASISWTDVMNVFFVERLVPLCPQPHTHTHAHTHTHTHTKINKACVCPVIWGSP